MRRLRVEQVAFPPGSDQVKLGTGTDAVSGETMRFRARVDLETEQTDPLRRP